jgi:hypothetical protein
MRKLAIVAMAAVGLGCPGGEDGDDGHDVITLRVATHEAESPFDGTVRVEAALEYDDCLLGFYEGEGAQLTADGVRGARVFDDWSTRLCEHDGLDAPASCEVLALDQRLDHAFLRVDYEVHDLVINEELAFGPIPDSSMTDCTPTMRVSHGHQLTGFDADDEVLWTTSSWQPERSESGGNQAIRIYAERAE